jgi:YHS domain-containing protein
MLMHGSHGGPSKAICPVSGATVKIKADTPSMTWKGRQLYFASEEHLKRFAAAPDSFKASEQVPASSSHEGH